MYNNIILLEGRPGASGDHATRLLGVGNAPKCRAPSRWPREDGVARRIGWRASHADRQHLRAKHRRKQLVGTVGNFVLLRCCLVGRGDGNATRSCGRNSTPSCIGWPESCMAFGPETPKHDSSGRVLARLLSWRGASTCPLRAIEIRRSGNI